MQSYPDVLPAKQLEVVIACCAAFPPAYMETLTSQKEKQAEKQYIERVLQKLPPMPNATSFEFSSRIRQYLSTRNNVATLDLPRPLLFLRRIHGLFSSHSHTLCVVESGHPALAVLDIARNAIMAGAKGAMSTSKQQELSGTRTVAATVRTAAATAETIMAAEQMRVLIQAVEGLGASIGGAERIQGTPLSVAYVSHLRSILLLVIATVAPVYWGRFRWATPIVVFLVTITLLGVEAAAVECERPFKRVPGVNHVDIEGLSKAACINVLQIVKHGVVNLEREERHLAAFICFFLKLVF